MDIRRLQAEGIFSFGVESDCFDLSLDKGLTVIVGPNASGKSNVGRVIDLVQTSVRFESAVNQESRSALFATLDDYARGARHDNIPPGARSTVRLTLRFSNDSELRLLTAYMQMLVMSCLFGNQVIDEQSLPALEAWVVDGVTTEAIASLDEGTIVISHAGIPGAQWSVGYEFEHAGVPLTWHLNTSIPNLTNTIAPRTWSAENPIPTVVTVTQRLLGEAVPSTRPRLPPEKPFSFQSLLPDGASLVRVDMSALNANTPPAPHRAFVDAGGITVSAGDPLGAYRRTYTFAAVLSALLDRSLRYLGPSSESGQTDGDERALLVNRLFALKNGDQLAQSRYRDVQSLFTALAPGHRFELHSRERTGVDEAPRWVPQVEVLSTGSVLGSLRPRLLRFAGTGVEQALVIAETVAGMPNRVLVLDEPATNLHPAWQRIVRTALGSYPGQCLLVTHSPYLMPTDDPTHLASIVRLTRRDGATRVHRLTTADLADTRWVATMIKELAWSADARGLLFASGAVLVEGSTELAALPAWFDKGTTAQEHGRHDDLHIGFHSVGGDQDFQAFIALLERFGVPWAVICDGAAFRFDGGKHIFEQVLQAGVHDTDLQKYVQERQLSTMEQSSMTTEFFSEMVQVGRAHGIFTLAPGWHRKSDDEGDQESFEAFVSSIPELKAAAEDAKVQAPRSKPRAGRLLAVATDCPVVVDALYEKILERLLLTGMPHLHSLVSEHRESEGRLPKS